MRDIIIYWEYILDKPYCACSMLQSSICLRVNIGYIYQDSTSSDLKCCSPHSPCTYYATTANTLSFRYPHSTNPILFFIPSFPWKYRFYPAHRSLYLLASHFDFCIHNTSMLVVSINCATASCIYVILPTCSVASVITLILLTIWTNVIVLFYLSLSSAVSRIAFMVSITRTFILFNPTVIRSLSYVFSYALHSQHTFNK